MSAVVWKQPDKFNFVAEDWPAWRDEFMSFRSASKLHKEDFKEQRDSLYYCMGTVEAKKIAANFKFEGKYKLVTVDEDGKETEEEKDQKASDFDCVIFKFTE